MRRAVSVGAAGGVVVAVLVWGEIEHWWASRAVLGEPRSGVPASEVLVVLGFANRSANRANALNRWRVRAALRSVDDKVPDSRLVFSGTTRPGGSVSEAELMARYAVRERGVSRARIQLEDRSRTTWENIQYSIPFMDDAESIKIVSNPLHALRGRLYLRRQRPDLARRIRRASDYRFGEKSWAKPFFALYGLLDLARTRKDTRMRDE
ncbi:YdcF family protein [Nocardia sp. NBC_01009]|uniref:YdcF family protein n=1 Tax=Nocardia sp. NBC_01009 TaxID=2975996 RepID=UPI00386AD7A9|nr:YdcF family protein [Nocardia sp. NBC_01009]